MTPVLTWLPKSIFSHLQQLRSFWRFAQVQSDHRKHFTCNNAQQPESSSERLSNPVLESSSRQSNLRGTGRGAAVQFVTLLRKKARLSSGERWSSLPWALAESLLHPHYITQAKWALQGRQLWQRRVNIHPNVPKITNLIDAKWLLKTRDALILQQQNSVEISSKRNKFGAKKIWISIFA